MKRTITCILAMLLVSLMLVSVFTACKSNGDKGGKETTAQTEEKKPSDEPDIKDGVLTFQEGDGVTFEPYSTYRSKKACTELISTYEAWVKMPEDLSTDVGVIWSDYVTERSWLTQPSLVSFSFQVAKDGVPQLIYNTEKGQLVIRFNNARLAANEWSHLAIVDDVANDKAYCYINGELKQTFELTGAKANFERKVSGQPIILGGDMRFNLGKAFRGSIRSLATFKSVRTQDEIKSDMKTIDLNDKKLLCCFELANQQGKATFKDLIQRYTVTNNRLSSEWLTADKVKLEDYDYSIAFLGDTQTTVYYYPETFPAVFDWLLANKDSHKIGHLLNGGDLTENGTEKEWSLVKSQFDRLNGVLDYTLTRGDHDVKDKANGYDLTFGGKEYMSRFEAEDAGVMKGQSITNSYRKVKIGGEDYLILTLDYDPSSSVMAWAKTILEKYTTEKVIITNHRYLDPSGSLLNEGKRIFNNLASKYANVKFCICGHKVSEDVVWVKSKGENGNIVNQVMINPQEGKMDIEGPLGMVGMFYFKQGSDEVQFRYYSTRYDRYFRTKNQFKVNINNMNNPVLAG